MYNYEKVIHSIKSFINVKNRDIMQNVRVLYITREI